MKVHLLLCLWWRSILILRLPRCKLLDELKKNGRLNVNLFQYQAHSCMGNGFAPVPKSTLWCTSLPVMRKWYPREMVQDVKDPVTVPDDVSAVLDSYSMEREHRTLHIVLWPPHRYLDKCIPLALPHTDSKLYLSRGRGKLYLKSITLRILFQLNL